MPGGDAGGGPHEVAEMNGEIASLDAAIAAFEAGAD